MDRDESERNGQLDFLSLFKPETMAVIGVSLHNDRHPANVIYNKNHLRYPVRTFPVNPKGGVIQADPVFASVSDIPEKIDLAVIVARAAHVPDIMTECIEAGVGGAVVISAGFAEVGEVALQRQITAITQKAGFPFIGPNCLGIYAPSQVDTFFLPSERMVRPEAGNVAVVSQSGGILVDQMIKFSNQGIGLSLAVSIGNKAMVGELDLLRYLIDDPVTKVIAFYVEGFGKREGREFVLAARRSPKPVIVMKAGKSEGASRAITSHTSSLAGDYATFSAVIRQCGIVEARSDFELVSFCESLSCYGRGIEGNVAIVTGSGGHGAIAVDLCTKYGLKVPPLSQAAKDRIRDGLSSSIKAIAALGNPIDLTGSAVDDDFVAAVECLSTVAEIDCILLLLLPYLPGISSDLGARLSQLYDRDRKPLLAYVPYVAKYRMLIEGFELNRTPVSPSVEGVVLMAEAMRQHSNGQ
jgi:acetyltransferase